MTQLDLLNRRSRRAGVNLLVDFLWEHEVGWIHRDDLAVELGVSVREIRLMAEASDGLVLSGQKGLCHLAYATNQEVEHAANTLLSQAKTMTERAVRIRNRFHRRDW